MTHTHPARCLDFISVSTRGDICSVLLRLGLSSWGHSALAFYFGTMQGGGF